MSTGARRLIRGHGKKISYADAVFEDNPVLFLKLGDVNGLNDISGNGHDAAAYGSPETTTMPNGSNALVFSNNTQYLKIADSPLLSVTKTGIITIEAWIRPDTLEFSNQTSANYVYFFGKEASMQYEYRGRMYSYTSDRPNRISGYIYNLDGDNGPMGRLGLGAGTYFQEPVTAGEWIHYVFTIDTTVDNHPDYPGVTRIYKNGEFKMEFGLDSFYIKPGDGTGNLYIGTGGNFNSFFEGAIGKFAIYDHRLSDDAVRRHYHAMVASA